LSSAIASYFEKHDHPKTTRADYTQATNALIAWGEDNGVSTVRQLTPGRLREFSLARAKMPKKVRKLGGRRGEMEDRGKLSEWTINKCRRNTSIVLNALRKLQVARLSRDEISDSLERTKVKLKRRDAAWLPLPILCKRTSSCSRCMSTRFTRSSSGASHAHMSERASVPGRVAANGCARVHRSRIRSA
jgi:hypothetical protein